MNLFARRRMGRTGTAAVPEESDDCRFPIFRGEGERFR